MHPQHCEPSLLPLNRIESDSNKGNLKDAARKIHVVKNLYDK